MKRSLIIWILVLGGVIDLHAQAVNKNVSKAGTTSATFLEIPVSARAIAFGSAFSAVANDISSLYWNPAGAARLEQPGVIFSHMNWIADLGFDYAAVAVPVGSIGTVGVSLTSLTMDDMAVRTIDKPEGTGELFSASSIAIGLHYALNLSDRFSIGFTGKYVQESIWHMSAQAFALDIGVLYTTEFFNNMKIGAIISNFGTDMKMAGRDSRLFDQIDRQKLGSNDRIPVNIEMDSWSLPLNFQFGVATDLFHNETQSMTIAVDALHPSDNYESINVGVEYGIYNTLCLRGGYRALGLSDSEGGLSLGAGFTGNLFGGGLTAGLDYAYSDHGRLQSSNVISLAIIF
ncbi:MAG: PorV/PorQ family protein [Bacteroidota bacterium]